MNQVHRLNRLIESCLDGRNGYQRAAERVEDNELKTLFRQLGQERERFAAEVRQVVQRQGGKPVEHGSAAGTLHRAWMGLKDAFGQGDDKIIAECIRGDEASIREYEKAIGEMKSAGGEVIGMLRRQCEAFRREVNQLRSRQPTMA